MDFELVKKVIKLAEESGLSGLAIEQNGIFVEVRREKAVEPHIIQAASVQAQTSNSQNPEKTGIEEEGIVAITSPMVGTFYRRPSPDSDSFVEVGSRVEVGKAVCIVEAMKLFNEIESEVSGIITKILVEEGTSVEYGQKLMLVKKE